MAPESPTPPADAPQSAEAVKTSFVYLIEHPEGPLKVGFARDVKKRLRELQISSPVKLTLIHAEEVDLADVQRVEATAHDLLRLHRLSGEWFRITPEQGKAAIALAISRVSQGVSRSPSVGRKRVGHPTTIDSLHAQGVLNDLQHQAAKLYRLVAVEVSKAGGFTNGAQMISREDLIDARRWLDRVHAAVKGAQGSEGLSAFVRIVVGGFAASAVTKGSGIQVVYRAIRAGCDYVIDHAPPVGEHDIMRYRRGDRAVL